MGEAASLSPSMPVGTLDFLEDPIRDETPEAGFLFDPELFVVQPVLGGVTHRVSGTPGLGVEFNEDAQAVKKAFEFWENRHLRRRDGSHTNW